MRLPLVEDYPPLQKSVAQGLREAGFAVDVSGDGQEALWYARGNPYDVIVLDLMLPGLDGLSLLRRLRAEGRQTHVLIITAKDAVPDRVAGLNAGADDYLVKPFEFEELLARVQALVRRSYRRKDPLMSAGPLRIDTAAQRVSRDEEELQLTAREYALLEYLALLLFVFGLVIDAAIEYMLVREFDFYLETVARTLAAAVETAGTHVEVKLVPEALPDIQQAEGELFSQYWTEDGAVLAKSANLARGDLPRFAGPVGQPRVQPLVLPDRTQARGAGLRFPIDRRPPTPERSLSVPPGRGAYLTLVVARDTTDLASHVRQLRGLLLAAGAGAMTAGAFVSWVVIQRSLRPLHRLAAAIAAIREDDLSARLPAATRPREIAPLVERLNELLERLEDAFARQRTLTADIAHELRTPVAGILSTAGVILTTDRSAAEYREALEDVRSIARRMRIMTDNLLMLARLDSQPAPLQREPVPVRELVELGWHACQKKAVIRRLSFENAVSGDLVWETDRNALAMVMANLLDNAVEYANESGRIWVTANRSADAVEIVVANTGCELTQDQVARVFDRFWRADAARKDASLHVGLGLALIRRLVTSLGGTANAAAAKGEFSVCIRLPSIERRAAVD